MKHYGTENAISKNKQSKWSITEWRWKKSQLTWREINWIYTIWRTQREKCWKKRINRALGNTGMISKVLKYMLLESQRRRERDQWKKQNETKKKPLTQKRLKK